MNVSSVHVDFDFAPIFISALVRQCTFVVGGYSH